MKESDELFQLIQSMSRSEKGYFKKFVSGNTDSTGKNYIRLFEFINDLKEYDEEKIKTKFKNEVFIKQLHVTKNYLFNLVLKSLRNFHSKASIDTQLVEYMRDAEILLDKSLYKQCLKSLVKAKKLAYAYERYPLLMQILRIEIRIADVGTIKGLLNEEREILKKLENLNLYRSLSAQLTEKLKLSNKVRNSKDLKELDAIMYSPLLSDESKAISLDSKIYFYNIHSNYYDLKEDHKNAYKYAKGFVTLLEEHPNQIFLLFGNYIMALNNLCNCQSNLGKYDECKETIKRIRQLPKQYVDIITEEADAGLFLTSYVLETDLHIKTGNFNKITGIIGELELGLSKLNGSVHLDYKLSVWYNIAYLYFGIKEYKKSLSWLNKIINMEETSIRKDIQSFARLMNLVIHYELGDTDILNYIIKSIDRFLNKHQSLYTFETMILEFIRKLAKSDNKKQEMELFLALKDQLVLLEKNPRENIFLDYFDFISWVESKINKVSFEKTYIKNRVHSS